MRSCPPPVFKSLAYFVHGQFLTCNFAHPRLAPQPHLQSWPGQAPRGEGGRKGVVRCIRYGKWYHILSSSPTPNHSRGRDERAAATYRFKLCSAFSLQSDRGAQTLLAGLFLKSLDPGGIGWVALPDPGGGGGPVPCQRRSFRTPDFWPAFNPDCHENFCGPPPMWSPRPPGDRVAPPGWGGP